MNLRGLCRNFVPFSALLLVPILQLGQVGCASQKNAMDQALLSEESLLSEEEGLRDPPARGAKVAPPTYVRDSALESEVNGPKEAANLRAPKEIQVATDTPEEEPPPAGEQAPPRSAKGGRAVPYASPKGTIRREMLVATLDKRPAAFLRQVDTEPRFEQGRFRGWRINSIFTGDGRFDGIDIQPGDVVTRINGKPIEMPDQFIQVWEDLRAARELRVDLLRNGQPHVSRWSIID